jgi:hypothetical protein
LPEPDPLQHQIPGSLGQPELLVVAGEVGLQRVDALEPDRVRPQMFAIRPRPAEPAQPAHEVVLVG